MDKNKINKINKKNIKKTNRKYKNIKSNKNKKIKKEKKIKVKEKTRKKYNKVRKEHNKNYSIKEYFSDKYFILIYPVLLLNLYYLYYITLKDITTTILYYILTLSYLYFLFSLKEKNKTHIIHSSLTILLINIIISMTSLIKYIIEKNITIKEYNYHIIMLFLTITLLVLDYFISKIDIIKMSKTNKK